MSYGAFVGVFWGVFSHCEASGNQSLIPFKLCIPFC